eukprot:661230-Amorphochlora_amoeboformis.AAC.1
MKADIDSLQRRNAELFNSLCKSEEKLRHLEDGSPQTFATPASRRSGIPTSSIRRQSYAPSSSHPDIGRLKQEIATLKEKLSHARKSNHPTTSSSSGFKNSEKLKKEVGALKEKLRTALREKQQALAANQANERELRFLRKLKDQMAAKNNEVTKFLRKY